MRYPVLVLLSILGVAGAGNVNAQVTANSKAAGLKECVAPTEFMLKNHMEILYHQRDQTMRQGIRTKQYSLVGCVACHAAQDSVGNFIPINAEGQFCQACHAATAVKMDCFQCHATKPEVGAISRNPPGTGDPAETNPFSPFFRSFSLNMNNNMDNYLPQMIDKTDSKRLPPATASVPGQAPGAEIFLAMAGPNCPAPIKP